MTPERVWASADLLGEPDENALGASDVAEPIHVFVLDHFVDELGAVLAEPGQRIVEVVHREHDAEVAEGVYRPVFKGSGRDCARRGSVQGACLGGSNHITATSEILGLAAPQLAERSMTPCRHSKCTRTDRRGPKMTLDVYAHLFDRAEHEQKSQRCSGSQLWRLAGVTGRNSSRLSTRCTAKARVQS
jgi:hypothetical protein